MASKDDFLFYSELEKVGIKKSKIFNNAVVLYGQNWTNQEHCGLYDDLENYCIGNQINRINLTESNITSALLLKIDKIHLSLNKQILLDVTEDQSFFLSYLSKKRNFILNII